MNTDEPLPDVLSRREQQVLLTQPHTDYPVEFRNLVFLRIELNYGLRLPEVRALCWEQIDLNNGRIQVEGVEAKDRVLWLHGDDVSLVRDWKRKQECCLKKRRLQGYETGFESDRVFTDLNGTPVSKQYARRMVATNANQAGIQREVSPETLRHTFATDLYIETCNLRLVQKAMGLYCPTSACMYRRVAKRKLKQSFSNLNNASVVCRQSSKPERDGIRTLCKPPGRNVRQGG